MKKEVIKESEKAIIIHLTGYHKFKGCQCFKDCSCKEDFKPSEIDCYSVTRKGKNKLFFGNLNEAIKRFDFVNSLSCDHETEIEIEEDGVTKIVCGYCKKEKLNYL